MTPLFKLVASASTLACTALLATSAAATVAVPVNQEFQFFGTCSDCTLNSAPGQPIATLTLSGAYAVGNNVQLDQIVSFSYVGSNLVDPFIWTGQAGVPPDTFADIYGVTGAMQSGSGAFVFRVDAIDGLGFKSNADGSWYVCGSKGNVFYSGACNQFNNNDVGTGGSWAPSAVPEPASMALLSLGLAVVGAAAARRRS